MNSQPLHLDGGSGGTPPLLAELRAISLPDLLAWHGLKPKLEGASFRAASDLHNLVVTGNLWFDNRTGTGGVGAIDLHMYLTGDDFPAACRTLAAHFRPSAMRQPSITFPPTKTDKSASERLPFPQLMAKYAVKDDGNWSIARAYLVEMRGIEPAIVDELHAVGSIFANDHRPHPSLVFLHRTDCGKVLGATLRGTRPDSTFRPCLGNKLTAWFAVGSVRDAHAVAAVESPIDALSYYCLYAGRTDRLAVVSCSGSTVPAGLMVQTYDRRQSFVVALDNDAAGERGWKKAWDATASWSGFKITADRPLRKDWNADLLAVRPTGKQRQSPQHSLFHA